MTYTTSPGSGQVRPSVSQGGEVVRFVWDAPFCFFGVVSYPSSHNGSEKMAHFITSSYLYRTSITFTAIFH